MIEKIIILYTFTQSKLCIKLKQNEIFVKFDCSMISNLLKQQE